MRRYLGYAKFAEWPPHAVPRSSDGASPCSGICCLSLIALSLDCDVRGSSVHWQSAARACCPAQVSVQTAASVSTRTGMAAISVTPAQPVPTGTRRIRRVPEATRRAWSALKSTMRSVRGISSRPPSPVSARTERAVSRSMLGEGGARSPPPGYAVSTTSSPGNGLNSIFYFPRFSPLRLQPATAAIFLLLIGRRRGIVSPGRYLRARVRSLGGMSLVRGQPADAPPGKPARPVARTASRLDSAQRTEPVPGADLRHADEADAEQVRLLNRQAGRRS